MEGACKGIVFGQLARQAFGAATVVHFALQIAIAPPAENQQGDVQENGIGQQQIGRFVSAEELAAARVAL